MTARMRKSDLDKRVVQATGAKSSLVSFITESFIEEIVDALSDGKSVEIPRFGKMCVKKQRGTAPPKEPFGGGPRSTDPGIRFRVCFSKSRLLRTEVWRKYKEKQFGKARR